MHSDESVSEFFDAMKGAINKILDEQREEFETLWEDLVKLFDGHNAVLVLAVLTRALDHLEHLGVPRAAIVGLIAVHFGQAITAVEKPHG